MNLHSKILLQRSYSLSGLMVLLALTLHLGGARLSAQNITFSVTPSANSVVLGDSVTYNINLTNFFSFTLPNVFVTNALSQGVTFVTATNTQGTFITNGSSGVFALGALFSGNVVRLALTVRPTAAGALTNFVTFFDTSVTNLPSTNVVTQVTQPQADLSLALAVPSRSLLVNDLLNYSLTVSNASATPVVNVQVTNTFPGMKFLSVSPSIQSLPLTTNGQRFILGTLAGRSAMTLAVAVQPTNAGTLSLFAAVGSPGFADVNLSNNVASVPITVSDFLPGQLMAVNASSMVFNPQTGLMEQTVRLSNVGTNSAPSARVIVSGLTNVLRNAAGTNNGNPFVVYGAALDPGQSVDLRLEYFIPTRLPISVPNSSYRAVAVPAADLSAPTGTADSFNITLVTNLPNGNLLIEFQSTPGGSYTVLYSTTSDFSTNVLSAQPAVIAPADRVQWIDDGPPKTISAPGTGSRFYRVRRN